MSNIIGKANSQHKVGVLGFFVRRQRSEKLNTRAGRLNRVRTTDTRLTRIYFSNGSAQYLTASGAIVQRP
jgi:hypothetical protein